MTNHQAMTFPETLRAMSIHFPFAWAIVHGEKDFEYRTRSTNYRGIFLVHSSGTKDSDEFITEYDIPKEQIIRKAIIGAVELIDCSLDREDGGYFYELDNPIAFEKPIPVSGQQSIFWSASTSERTKAFNQAWLQIPKFSFMIENRGDVITLVSSQMNEKLDVSKDGTWRGLASRVKNNQIDLAKAEIDALLDEITEFGSEVTELV